MRRSDIYRAFDGEPNEIIRYWGVAQKLGIIKRKYIKERMKANRDYARWKENPFEYELKEMVDEDA